MSSANHTNFIQNIITILSDPSLLSALGGFVLCVLATLSNSIKNWYKTFINKVKKEKNNTSAFTADYTAKSISVVNKINELRAEIGCSRVAVAQFRNGTTFLMSSPMLRIYWPYESLRQGVKSISFYFNDQLCTTILDFIGPLIDSNMTSSGVTDLTKYCVLYGKCPRAKVCPRVLGFKINEMSYTPFKFLLESSGIAYVVASPIYSNGNLIGIFTVQFLDINKTAEERAKAVIDKICNAANYVQAMLTVR